MKKMKILIIGSTGNVGRRVVEEARNRGHEVSVMVRRLDGEINKTKPIKHMIGDAANVEDVKRCSQNHDIVISAIRPKEGNENELIKLTQHVMKGVCAVGGRVIIVGGAARLLIPKENGETVLTMPGFLPTQIVDIAKACQAQFDMCVTDKTTNWTYLSPPPMLVPGERTGAYRVGADQLVVDQNGKSAISLEDFAVALVDEAEQAKHIRKGFTVAN